jgi:hypothetical protein
MAIRGSPSLILFVAIRAIRGGNAFSVFFNHEFDELTRIGEAHRGTCPKADCQMGRFFFKPQLDSP